jgi:DNA-binding NarL/FixJ family response regulator
VPAVRAYPTRTTEPRSYVTARQRQILTLAANGNTNRGIGRALGIGEEAVKSQMQKVLRKLRADDRTQAVAVALRLGLISLEDVAVPPHANQGYHHTA